VRVQFPFQGYEAGAVHLYRKRGYNYLLGNQRPLQGYEAGALEYTCAKKDTIIFLGISDHSRGIKLELYTYATKGYNYFLGYQ
jgi:hypothetical protein